MRKIYLTSVFLIFIHISGFTQYITGRVSSAADKLPLTGASVYLKGTSAGTLSDSSGNFRIGPVYEGGVLLVSYMGFYTREYPIKIITGEELHVSLNPDENQLEEVVISTGYQNTSHEVSTGSVVSVNQKLLNRRVSTDIMSRLEDVVPGLIFRRGKGAYSNAVSIRGRSTIQGNTAPLIVVDNFPFEGDLNAINPNDIASVTVLKDAAAASIWGARAGNGVIVITTIKGRAGGIQVSLNSNLTVSQRPDLYYRPRMTSADFIETEKMLFERGYYRAAELSPAKAPLTPAVELMIAGRDGLLSAEQVKRGLEEFRMTDVRNDISRYMYRSALNQQYALNLSGGTAENRFYFSLGADHNLAQEVRNKLSRISFSGTHSILSKDRKLEFNSGVYFTHTATVMNNTGAGSVRMNSFTPVYPYARLADEYGNPLATVYNYRRSFAQEAMQNGLLDWEYRHLEELNLADNHQGLTHYRGNIGVKYSFMKGLMAEAMFQYGNDQNRAVNLNGLQTFFARDLINNYTQMVPGGVAYPIPPGAVKDQTFSAIRNLNLRTQLNYNRNWQGKHEVSAIMGYEVRENVISSSSFRAYGYNPSTATLQPVDYVSNYRFYYYPQLLRRIPFNDSESKMTDRFLSNYTSGNYVFSKKYLVSGSARFDQSNLIGVKSRGVPLWSAGLGWNLHQEAFYRSELFPLLKLRATFGYSGNVNKTVTALTTAIAGGAHIQTGLPFSTIVNPPNPSLRWERVRTFNTGLDFEIGSQFITGSLDVFTKRGIDLISTAPFAPSSGITSLTGNTASTSGKGFDLNLHLNNLRKQVSWSTDVFVSYIDEKIEEYHL